MVDLFMADLVGSIVIFIFCTLFNTFSIFDPAWTIQCSVISTFYLIRCQQQQQQQQHATGESAMFVNHLNVRSILVFALVNFWSIRLTSNLFINSVTSIRHEDWRYSDFRIKLRSTFVYYMFGFMSFILLPTVVVFFGCVPMYYIFEMARLDDSNVATMNTVGEMFNLNLYDLLAFVITLTGILIESVADQQLRNEQIAAASKQQPNRLVCMDKGLWGLSRHPNYFGEIVFWFGLYLFGLAAGATVYDRFYLLTLLLGPFGVFAIIYFGSMPLMEERQLIRRHEFYTDYIKRVPNKLIPINFRRKINTNLVYEIAAVNECLI